MTFTKSDLSHVARLARLSLSNEENERLLSDLERIIKFVEQLREVNVEEVLPLSHAGEHMLEFRKDEALPSLGRECIQSSAGYEDGLVRVPKIIE